MLKISLALNWNEYLDLYSNEQMDIYFTEEYAKLYEDKDSKAECVVCADGEKCLLMPFIKREIPNSLLPNSLEDRIFYDLETPYGYGGFISNADEEWTKKAMEKTVEELKDNNYVCGFLRFHPLLKNAGNCRNIFPIIDDRKTIAIDTSQSIDDIWAAQISSKNRNMIRKAEKSGLCFVADYDFKYMDDFIKLYGSTMERLSADGFYFFSNDYYTKFKDILKGKSFLGIVKFNDEVVAAAMFMYSKDYGHYHLAGSNRDGTRLGANNFMLWNAAKEMNKLGVKEFHLGGGTDGDPENSLFKFKSSFSKNEKQFSIGKLIVNEEVYKSICEKWEKENPEMAQKYGNRLLKYRY